VSPFRSEDLALTERLRRLEEANADAEAELRKGERELLVAKAMKGSAHAIARGAVWVVVAVVTGVLGSLLGSFAGGPSWSEREALRPEPTPREAELTRCWESQREARSRFERCVGAHAPR
jgi:ribosomal protein S19